MRAGNLNLVVTALLCLSQHVANLKLADLRRRLDRVVGEHDGEEGSEHEAERAQ